MSDYEALHYDKDKLRQACKKIHQHTHLISCTFHAALATVFAVTELFKCDHRDTTMTSCERPLCSQKVDFISAVIQIPNFLS